MRRGLLLLLIGLASLCVRAETVLRFATWDDAETLAIQQKLAALFETRHPGVKVQVEAYGGGFNQKLSAAFGARNPPDVTYMWNFPVYHTSLEPLDAYLARDKGINTADMVPGLQAFTVIRAPGRAAQTFGIPVGFTSQVIYYNKDMFDRAGLAYPQPGWSWDDLKALAVRLRNKDKKAYGYGVDVNPDPYDFQSYLWSAGTRMLAADGKTVQGQFNSPESNAVFAMLIGLLDQDLAAVLGVGDGKDQRQLFISDRVAMLMDGTGLRTDLAKAGKRYGVASLPRFPGRPAQSVVSVSALAIAKDSAQKDLAWEFLKFYSSAEAVRLRVNELPMLLSVAREMKLQDDPTVRPFYEMVDSARETPAFLLNRKWTRAQGVVREAIQAALLKRTGVPAILDHAARKAETKLR